MRNLVRLSSFVALAFAISTPTVTWASSVCDSLVEQLANTAEVFGSTDQSRKYDSAIKAQADQIHSARYDMKRLGCSQGSVIVYGGANGVMCDKLATTLHQMENNLQQLTATKATLASGFSNDGNRQNLLQAYKINHCASEVSEAEGSIQSVSMTNELDNSGYSNSTNEAVIEEPEPPKPVQPKKTMVVVPLGRASEGGSLKTLCVRTCDGGFFPISQGADPKDFRRDARVCSMMCPGTETQLFYNDNASDKPEEMVSVATGNAYSELPRAFAYRDKPGTGGAKCGCNFSAYYREMMRREAELTKQSTPSQASPQQSMASVEIRTEMQNTTSASREKFTSKLETTPRKVRIVGPAFLQDDSAAIDLKHPLKNKLN